MPEFESLPDYSDDEVEVFHPAFKKALEAAISAMDLRDILEIVHHWRKPKFGGIIDFAVVNRQTQKVLLPIEIKKTVIDLRAIGRQQARGYSENLGRSKGSDFYMVSNLECNELFKFSVDRPLTVAQLLKIDGLEVGDFESAEPDDFYRKLVHALKIVLATVRANDGTIYASNVSGLINALETRMNDIESWRQAIAVYSYDYIRGALIESSRQKDEVITWPKFVDLVDDFESISAFASRIDFGLIFGSSITGSFNRDEMKQISAGAFEAGKSLDYGNEVSSIINEIAANSKKIPGVVQTPPPLARLLSYHSINQLDRELTRSEQIFEPGCGGGNLIVEFKSVYTDSLNADQIFGIEKEVLFRELLALRVGLVFSGSLSPSCKPNLTIRDLTEVDSSECKNIALTLMNPPFIRGIDASKEKEKFGNRISFLTECAPKLTGGQLGLECAFLELVCALLPKRSIVGLVFPKNAILRSESFVVRKFLIEEFGLCQIITYPETKIFGDVQKSTTVLVGVVGSRGTNVLRTSYTRDITDLDFFIDVNDVERRPSSSSAGANSVSRLLPIKLFEESIKRGWKGLLASWFETYETVSSQLHSKTCALGLSPRIEQIRRGSIGNAGMSEFLFNPNRSQKSSQTHCPEKWKSFNMSWIFPALKNADVAPVFLTADSGESAVSIPEASITEVLVEGVYGYLQTELKKSALGKQLKKAKTKKAIGDIINSSKPIFGNFVFIPRAERRKARITISKEKLVMVSTNFHAIKVPSYKDAVVIGSWFFSIFGQLELEFESIDQEGMRKLEVEEIKRCKIPIELEFSDGDFLSLENALFECSARDFLNLNVNKVDQIWARRLFGDLSDTKINEVISLLSAMCRERLNR